jgi:hypothetical protein
MNSSQIHRDCSCSTHIYPKRNRTNNCLRIHVGQTEILSNVFCSGTAEDPETNSWLMIQNRQTNAIDFNRSWTEYRRGFGNIRQQIDFWIGNENLYWLTNRYQCRLKVELTDWYNETRTATYETFHISSQAEDYRIHIDEYHGNIETFRRIDSKTILLFDNNRSIHVERR